jgi:NADH-quinone oxidoreductase subunit K
MTQAVTSIPLNYYLTLSAVLFAIGVIGVLTRRNAIIVFMSVELMLNSVNLTLVAFSAFLGNSAGQVLVFIVMAVAAAEAAVGLAIILALFRNKQTVNIEEINLMKW